MKKLFAVLAILVLVLAGCGDKDTSDDGKGNGNGTMSGTTLTIKNTSDYDFINVIYGTTTFGAIASGASQTKGVAANSSKPISFFLNLTHIESGTQCQTSEFSCDEGKNRQITINNSTTVTTDEHGNDTIENISYFMEAATGKH